MKKVLVLLLALSSGVLYGVCACQLNKPRPQTAPAQAKPASVQKPTKSEETPATPAPEKSEQDENVAAKE